MYARNKFIHAASLLPVGAVIGIFCFEWYAFNVAYAMHYIEREAEDVLPFFLARVSLFNLLWAMALWSYGRAAASDPGMIPEAWYKYIAEWDLTGTRPLGSRMWEAEVSLCGQCNRKRPLRAHHCSVCGQCMTRMDHHCPWIGNCVGFKNHKYFMLMTFYGALACLMFAASVLPQLKLLMGGFHPHAHRRHAEQHHGHHSAIVELKNFMVVGIGGVFCLAFSFSLSLLCISHIWLLSYNLTSVEVSSWGKNRFQLGVCANWQQIFGKPDLAWLLPVPPLQPISDGLAFPTTDADDSLQEVVGLRTDIDDV